MLKSNTGTERSVHTTTCASTAVAEALLIESRVLIPFGLPKSTSKYGSSNVAAGTSSMVQRMARAGMDMDAKAAATSRTTVSFLIRAPPWESSRIRLENRGVLLKRREYIQNREGHGMHAPATANQLLLCDMEAGIGDALAAVAGAAAGGVEMAGGALEEGEAEGEAAGGVDAQPLGPPPEAPLDVAEILLQNPRRSFQLPPQLLEPPLPCAQEVDDPLAERRGRFETRVRVVHDQYSAPGGATRVSSSLISRRMRPSIRQRSRRPARLSSPA